MKMAKFKLYSRILLETITQRVFAIYFDVSWIKVQVISFEPEFGVLWYPKFFWLSPAQEIGAENLNKVDPKPPVYPLSKENSYSIKTSNPKNLGNQTITPISTRPF